MKNLLKIILFTFISIQLYAQSDYEIVQNFKNAVSAIERRISHASSVNEVDGIKTEIEKLKREYLQHKDLLNGSLYPDTFDSVFQKLANKIDNASVSNSEKEELENKVVELETNVKQLKNQIDKLRSENASLFEQLNIYKAGRAAGHNVIDSLNRTIARLQQNLASRDKLISKMIDSLFLKISSSPVTLNNIEKNEIAGRMRNTDILSNIKQMVIDNINFINTGELHSSDLANIRENYLNFSEKWSVFGRNLVQIYGSSKEESMKLDEINQLLSDWDHSFDPRILDAIKQNFEIQNIQIDPFTNFEEFYSSIIKFFNDSEENPEIFMKFKENIWDSQLSGYWLNLMQERSYLSNNQITEINNKFAAWEESVSSPSSPLQKYGLILALLFSAVVIIFAFAARRKK